jgi:large subunit ribosomal protein L3
MVHGSLQYWPHRRAHKRLPRVRGEPKLQEQIIGNLVAYKVGMTHLSMIDDSESPSKQMEVSRPCTVLEVPRMEAYGLRLYAIDPITHYYKTVTEIHSKAASQKLNVKKVKNDESSAEKYKQKLNEFSHVGVLMVAYPDGTSVGQHHNVRFETVAGGKTIEEQFNHAVGMLGKEVKASDVFKPGEYVDITSISTGKGWQGPVKRFGVAQQPRKATEKRRHVGSLGDVKLARVLFTAKQAGQMGFNYRTEHNKRILKMGGKNDVAQVNKASGFINYGKVDNDYILILGSIPGPAKRLVRIRKSIRGRNASGIKEPKITEIAK